MMGVVLGESLALSVCGRSEHTVTNTESHWPTAPDLRVRYDLDSPMHELGIAASILESVQSEAERHPGGHITLCTLQSGRGPRKCMARPSSDGNHRCVRHHGEGLDLWMEWLRLRQERAKAKVQAVTTPH